MSVLSTRWRQSRIWQGLAVGAACGLSVLLYVVLGWGKGLEQGAYDAMFHLRGWTNPSPNVVIVEADESTLERYGPWPFRRHIYANLVRRLNEMGAKTIVFDVQFPAVSSFPADDRAFAASCRASGKVIQAGVFTVTGSSVFSAGDTASQTLNKFSERFRLRDRVSDHRRFGRDAVSGTASIAPLLESAAGFGHVTVYPESDGALRRIPHYVRYKGQTYPSLALAAAAHFLEIKPNEITVTDNALQIAERRIPLAAKGESLVNWCGPTATFPTYTFQQVLATNDVERLPKEAIEGAIVLVGITHPGAYESYATPVSPHQPAVELQATAIDNILENRPFREVPEWLPLVLIMVMSLLSGLFTSQRDARRSALAVFVISSILWACGYLLLTRGLIYLPMAAPILASVLTCAATLGFRQLRDAHDLKTAEERYALAVKGANDGIWDWNLQSGEIYYSPRWKTLLGIEDGVLPPTADSWIQRVHPDDLPKVETELQRHLRGDTPHFENEHRLRHADGDYRWVYARGLRFLQDGKPARMAGSISDISLRKQAEEQLLHNAFYDGLTGLPNRALFMERLERAMTRARRHPDYQFAVLFLDLDRFKVVNDSLGHGMGDQLLVLAARRLSGCLRPGDTAARLGGDEFTLLVDDITHNEDAMEIANRIQTELARPFDLQGHPVVSTASIGIVVGREKGEMIRYEQPQELLRDADTALYRAKALGRARHEVFDEAMHVRAVSLLKLEADLRLAVENEEFQVFYQPIVSLQTGYITGFEALVRWQHPTRGIVQPGEFIPLAEETGLIVPLDEWILREACRQTQTWIKQLSEGLPEYSGHNAPGDRAFPLSINVNLSSRHFSEATLTAKLRRLLEEFPIEAQSLHLEITESVVLDNLASTTLMLQELKKLGLRLAIDDFGTGYSSLSYLHHLPLDILKIDRSFIARLGQNGENIEIIRAIITLARNLNMETVAEGVETTEQLDLLKTLGCNFGQGYLFSSPVSGEEATALLRKQRARQESGQSLTTAQTESATS